MASLDYSRWDGVGDSSSDEDVVQPPDAMKPFLAAADGDTPAAFASFFDAKREEAELRGEGRRDGETGLAFAVRLGESEQRRADQVEAEGDELATMVDLIRREACRKTSGADAMGACADGVEETKTAANRLKMLPVVEYLAIIAKDDKKCFTATGELGDLTRSLEGLAYARGVDSIELGVVAMALMYRVPVAGAPSEGNVRSTLAEIHAHERFALYRAVAMEQRDVAAGRATTRVPDAATRPVRVDERLRKKLARRRCDVCDLRVPLSRSHFRLCDGCGQRRYCGVSCQRRDWLENRHCDDCEDLARHARLFKYLRQTRRGARRRPAGVY